MAGRDRQVASGETAPERVLGITFYNNDPAQLVQEISATGGLVVMPAAPALLKLKFDAEYRRALSEADYVLADSALLSTLWRGCSGRRLRNLSGLNYLTQLMEFRGFANAPDTIWVVASDEAKRKALVRLRADNTAMKEPDIYVAQRGASGEADHALLLQLEERKPAHVVIALASGTQEKLGLYLRSYLLYRPAIHCVGAALGFLTGAEAAIPRWAQRNRLGWLARFAAQPAMILPRIGIAISLAAMVLKYKSEMPPLRMRWSDL